MLDCLVAAILLQPSSVVEEPCCHSLLDTCGGDLDIQVDVVIGLTNSAESKACVR
jgi:hypothetical protein